MQKPAKIYHVCPKYDGEDLKSLAKLEGEEEAFRIFEERWPEGDPTPDIYQVHGHLTLEDAKRHQEYFGGEILEIDVAIAEETGDADCIWHREGHLAFGGRIPAGACRKI